MSQWLWVIVGLTASVAFVVVAVVRPNLTGARRVLTGVNWRVAAIAGVVLVAILAIWWWQAGGLSFSLLARMTAPFIIIMIAALAVTVVFGSYPGAKVARGLIWSGMIVYLSLATLLLFQDWQAGVGLFTPDMKLCSGNRLSSTTTHQCIAREKEARMSVRLNELPVGVHFVLCFTRPIGTPPLEIRLVAPMTVSVRTPSGAGEYPVSYRLIRESELRAGMCSDTL